MTPLLRLYGNWATQTPIEHSLTHYVSISLTTSPLVRLIFGLIVIYFFTSGDGDTMMNRMRFKSAMNWGIVVACLVWMELSPFLLDGDTFVSSSSSSGGGDSDTTAGSSATTSKSSGYNEYTYQHSTHAPFASVALKLLTFTSFLVGMATGSLLPRFVTGCSLGVMVGLVVEGLFSGVMMVGGSSFVGVAGGGAVVLGGIGCW